MKASKNASSEKVIVPVLWKKLGPRSAMIDFTSSIVQEWGNDATSNSFS